MDRQQTIGHSAEERMTAYRRGVIDRGMKVLLDECPYSEGELRDVWREGWLDEAARLRQQRYQEMNA